MRCCTICNKRYLLCKRKKDYHIKQEIKKKDENKKEENILFF